MTECANAEIRDLLPELLASNGTRADLAHVRSHVAACDACRSELALLRSVRSAVRAPAVDAGRIAAAIPPYRAASPWQRMARPAAVRIAATVVLVAGLGALIRGAPGRGGADTAAVVAAAAPPTEIAISATLSDLTDAQLQDLLRELGELEAVTPTDADVIVVPSFDRNGA